MFPESTQDALKDVLKSMILDPQNASKIDPKRVQNHGFWVAGGPGRKTATQTPKKSQRVFSVKPFGGLSWPQVGLQVEPSWAKNRLSTSLKFRVRFRMDFGASWARFWRPFGVPNRVQKRT